MKRLIYNHPDNHYNGIYGEVIIDSGTMIFIEDKQGNGYHTRKQFTITPEEATKKWEVIWKTFTCNYEEQKKQHKEYKMLNKFLLNK